MSTQPLDASGTALGALQSIVADYGAASLSDAQFMNNVLRDLLPDEPREASVLVAAAEADVAGIIRERTDQHISPGAAIAQAATVLGERTALTPYACQWAANQLARAMGLLPGPGPEQGPGPAPGPGQAPGMDQTASVAVGPSAPPASYPPPGQAPPPAPFPPPYEPTPYQPPAPVPPAPAFAQSPGAAQPPGVPPTAAGPAPLGYGPAPAGTPRSPGGRTTKLVAGGVAAVVVLYLVIAAAAHLAPFGHAKSHTPAAAPPPVSHTASPSSSPSPSPTPSVSSTAGRTADQTRLFHLIPSSVQSHGTCKVDKLEFGSIAQISCRNEHGIPPAGVTYYLFATAAKTSSAYNYFRGTFAKTTKQAGDCADFVNFVPCETSYSVKPTNTTQGRIVEYRYKGDPDMSFTSVTYKVLIDAVADKGKGNGNALLKWWQQSTGNWLNGKL